MDHIKGFENVKDNTKRLLKNLPDTMNAFFDLSKTVYKDGSLSVKQKELITVGIAVAIRCEGCIEAHAKKCIQAGVTKEELAEVISVAIAMGGGPSTIYGGKLMEAFEQFLEQE